MITRLNHLALKATDPVAAARFGAEKLGFEHVHTDERGATYLRAVGGIDPYSIVYVPGDGPGLDHASYLVADAVALEEAVVALQERGIAFERVETGEWEHERSVRFATPSGHVIELTTGVHTDVPVAHGVSSNGHAGAQPVTTDHVGLSAVEFESELAFATEVLGLLPSNRVLAPGDVQVMSFLRAPKRFLYHCLVVVRGEEPGVHHYQMSLKSVDTFYATYEALKAAGVDVGWGPLRHGPGHNIAMYFQDGAGYWVEYSVEEELILDDEHYEPRTWTVADPHVVDEWNSGAPPLGLMGPPPMPPDTPEQAEIRKNVFARVGQMINKRLYVGISTVNMTSMPPSIDVVGEHLKYALELEAQGVLFAAGPFVDDEGQMVGDGLFVVRAGSKAEAEAILAKDPIHVGNYRTCVVHGWTLHEGRINLAYNLSDQTYTLE